MKEELISFETAKLAKEKGFPQSYDYSAYRLYDKEGDSAWEKDQEEIIAPTQSLLQRWIREEHNIDVQPYLIEFTHNKVQKPQKSSDRDYTYRIYNEGIDEWVSFKENQFKTYEEALEKALYEALKLIKTK